VEPLLVRNLRGVEIADSTRPDHRSTYDR
jgi:hypothetical protein